MKTNLSINCGRRRGVTLLFVLSMIVLFLLMGASFMLIANQFRRSATLAGRIKVRRDDARSLVSRAFYDVLRGPDLHDIGSPLRFHSILEDMYGYGAISFVTDAAAQAGLDNQIINLTLDYEDPSTAGADSGPEDQFLGILDGGLGNFSNRSGEYNGQILTFVSGPAAGLSCRIVSYQVTPGGTQPEGLLRGFAIVPVWDNKNSTAFTISPADLVNSKVVINGRAFQGTGAGSFDPLASFNSPALGNNAMAPNQNGIRLPNVIAPAGYLGLQGSPNGNFRGPNEDYDISDLQNMFLAGGFDSVDGSFISSFSRGSLERATGSSAQSVFRAFNRGTPNPAKEVDNDGDNTADSYWMDIGLPIQSDSKGRIYRPLVAYMIVDMDNRVNVNAHGNWAHLNGLYKTNLGLLETTYGSGTFGTAINAGQGYGPPDINLLGVMSAAEANAVLNNRYGVDGVPGANNRDFGSQYKLFGYPQASFATPGLIGNHFRSPMDAFGRFGYGTSNTWLTGIDVDPYGITAGTSNIPVGLPVADIATSTNPNPDEITNSPFEFNFVASPFVTAPNDSPFTPSDLEGYLRQNDPDSSSLPNRLRQILSAGVSNAITTDSQEVPVPPTNLNAKLYEVLTGAVGGMPVTTPTDRQAVDRQIALMLAPEVRRGQRMDVNRPFGNGVDDGVTDNATQRGTGTVDEPGEQIVGEDFVDPYARIIPFDANNDGIATGANQGLARQVFARHLYVLTLLVTQWVDRNGDGSVDIADWYDYDNSGGPPDINDLYAYRHDVAQWAINVADFRDPDSIMTPFEYDLNPWDGWNVDGVFGVGPGPDGIGGNADDRSDDNDPIRQLVWGAEHPDLLISETYAQHIRKTEDLSDDSSGSGHAISDGDSTTDSRFVPDTSAFIELKACRYLSSDASVNANNHALPAELYGVNGLDLQRTSLDGSSPVWRLSVRARYLGDATPDDTSDDMDQTLTPDPGLSSASELRRVYFVQPTIDSGLRVFYPDGLTLPELPTGQYAVVGGGIRNGSRYDTYFGHRTTPTWTAELNDTRRISLTPNANINNNFVELRFWNGSTWNTQVRGGAGQPLVAIPVDQPYLAYEGGRRPFGLTDPISGYGPILSSLPPTVEIRKIRDGVTVTSAGFEFYDTATNLPYAIDNPVDRPNPFVSPSPWENLYVNGTPVFGGVDPFTPSLSSAGIRDDGLLRNHSAVFLQRLANPLLPFDAQSNPYITVDALGVDINVANGASSVPEPDAVGSLPNFLASVERGTNEKEMLRQHLNWKSNNDGRYDATAATYPELNTQTVGDSHFRSFNVLNSLGEIDMVYRYDQTATFPTPPATTVSYPWFGWNDRPYVSHQELVMVPYGNSLTMLGNFDVLEAGRDPYQGTTAGDPFNMAIPRVAGQFGHLFGFHADSYSSAAVPSGAPSLHKIMDYLEVPSRFVGTEKQLNPAVFTTGSGSPSVNYLGLNPPFNSFSDFRYPGKINLNTLNSQQVYNALMGNYGGSFGQFMASKTQGASNTVPTDFPNVFRAAEFNNFVPPSIPIVSSSAPTLFRSGGANPLFDLAAGTGPHNDPNRSAYFRYDVRQRLGNLATTRSSVFAVWITVGFFEVDPLTGNVTDVEMGADTGNTNRYRGFYMIDRSIPVALEPGKNHNVDQAVLCNTIIEE